MLTADKIYEPSEFRDIKVKESFLNCELWERLTKPWMLHTAPRRKPQNRLMSDSGALPLLGTSSKTLFASSHFVCLQQGKKRQGREKILDGEARRGGEDMGVLSVCERTSGHESFRDRVVEWKPPCGTLPPPLSPFSGSSDVDSQLRFKKNICVMGFEV